MACIALCLRMLFHWSGLYMYSWVRGASGRDDIALQSEMMICCWWRVPPQQQRKSYSRWLTHRHATWHITCQPASQPVITSHRTFYLACMIYGTSKPIHSVMPSWQDSDCGRTNGRIKMPHGLETDWVKCVEWVRGPEIIGGSVLHFRVFSHGRNWNCWIKIS